MAVYSLCGGPGGGPVSDRDTLTLSPPSPTLEYCVCMHFALLRSSCPWTDTGHAVGSPPASVRPSVPSCLLPLRSLRSHTRHCYTVVTDAHMIQPCRELQFPKCTLSNNSNCLCTLLSLGLIYIRKLFSSILFVFDN